MNPFLLAFIRGSSFSNANNDYQRVTLSSLALASGAALAIAGGIELFVDTDATLGVVSVATTGKITFDPTRDITLLVDHVVQDSATWWQISAADGVGPYTKRARIILTGAPETKTARPNHPVTGINQGYTTAGFSRTINNHGTRYWRGLPKLLPKTKLSRHANTGATDCYLKGDCSDYAIGDEIIIAPTNYAGMSSEERRVLTSVGGYNATTDETRVFWGASYPLTEDHWGLLQYPIDAPYGTPAISLTQGAFTPPDSDTPIVYDTRAEVLNISNGNITVESLADSASANGFGASIMDHPGSQYHDEGVRIIGGGKRGEMGHYAFHAHKLSYTDPSSAITFDTSGALIRVNWPAHGIVPIKTNNGTGAFSQNPYYGAGAGSISVVLTGVDESAVYNGLYATFQQGPGSTLASGITAGRVYWLRSIGGHVYIVCSSYVDDITLAGAPLVAWVDNGTGTTNIVNCSVSDQPIAFTTTGTLPSALAVGAYDSTAAQFIGSKYKVVGCSITADSFAIFVTPSSGAGSGVHTAKYTTFVADHPECRRIKCTVDGSVNRAFVTHASCGTEISDCIAYDIRGQACLWEDGSELRSKAYRNTVILVRNPVLTSDRLKDFDGEYANSGTHNDFQSSGFWFPNPDMDVQDNIGILCDGFGVHNSYGTGGTGISALVNVAPFKTDIRRWRGNGGHSNWLRGVATQDGVTDEFGRSDQNVNNGQYAPTNTGLGPAGYAANLMEGGIAWKNRQGAYINSVQVVGPLYVGWTIGDHEGGGFEGSTQDSAMKARSHLIIGHSLLPAKTSAIDNQFTGYLTRDFGNATYHFTLIFEKCAYQNFPWQRPFYVRAGQQDNGGGATSWRDQYTNSIASQFRFVGGNKYNNAHPGHLTREPRLAGYPVTLTLANPCVVTVAIADVALGVREFTVAENEPLFITRASRGTGVMPSPLTKGLRVYAKYARDEGGTLVGLNKTGVTFQLSLTPGGTAISTAGSSQSGTICMHPMWREATQDGTTPKGTPWIYGMGTIMPDPNCYYGRGSTGSTPRWVCPYSDEPFFYYDAANAIDCEPVTSDGVFGLGFSTTDIFVGVSDLHTDKTDMGNTAGEAHSGIRAVRYNADMSVRGTYNLDSLKSNETPYFQNFQHTALKNRGIFSIKADSDIASPVSYSCIRLVLANDPAVDLMVGIEFSGSATPNKVFRTIRGAGAGPYDPDAATGMSVTCTSVASFALASASSDGSKFWHDTSNNLVWVRWAALPGNATYDAYIASLKLSDPEAGDRSSWFVVQHV